MCPRKRCKKHAVKRTSCLRVPPNNPTVDVINSSFLVYSPFFWHLWLHLYGSYYVKTEEGSQVHCSLSSYPTSYTGKKMVIMMVLQRKWKWLLDVTNKVNYATFFLVFSYNHWHGCCDWQHFFLSGLSLTSFFLCTKHNKSVKKKLGKYLVSLLSWFVEK